MGYRLFQEKPRHRYGERRPRRRRGISISEEAVAYGEGYAGNGAFKLANEVARALRKEFAGQNKMAGMYAYSWHSDPPPFELEHNVYISLTMGFNEGRLSLDELFEEWPKIVKNLGFYDYYSVWFWDHDNWSGGRAGNTNYVTSQIRRFRKTNALTKAYATSISAESSNNWGVNGRGYYLANKLIWNTDLDKNAI